MINPQAGLGAMMQPAQTQKGMPASNMSQIMSTAKGMSDAQLADVMAGKSMDVPQYVAMTEAMGRQQLRTAMQGATAMTTAKQPTEKEKLLLAMQHIPQQSLAQDPAVAAAIAARQGQQPQHHMQKRATVAQQTREQMTQVGKTCLLMVMAALAIALDMCIWFFSVPRRALVHLAMWLNEEQ